MHAKGQTKWSSVIWPANCVYLALNKNTKKQEEKKKKKKKSLYAVVIAEPKGLALAGPNKFTARKVNFRAEIERARQRVCESGSEAEWHRPVNMNKTLGSNLHV